MARRENTVVDSFPITSGGTFERVETPTGRIFLLSSPRTMYWMQDSSDEQDDEIVAQINQFLTNPQDAAPEGETTNASDGDALAQAIRASTASVETENAASSSNGSQVDALSNILENLGMPQGTVAADGAAPAAPTGTLTLADLQGAMAGLATASPAGSSGPPLQEVVTPAAITALLEDEAVRNRLLEFLPEEQRSLEHLEENLRSPQVQQTLRSLTAALMPDDVGGMDGYHSVLANFQLNPQDGEAALRAGNPIQAFLDCVLASVSEESEETKEEEETKQEEESKDAMEE